MLYEAVRFWNVVWNTSVRIALNDTTFSLLSTFWAAGEIYVYNNLADSTSYTVVKIKVKKVKVGWNFRG